MQTVRVSNPRKMTDKQIDKQSAKQPVCFLLSLILHVRQHTKDRTRSHCFSSGPVRVDKHMHAIVSWGSATPCNRYTEGEVDCIGGGGVRFPPGPRSAGRANVLKWATTGAGVNVLKSRGALMSRYPLWLHGALSADTELGPTNALTWVFPRHRPNRAGHYPPAG